MLTIKEINRTIGNIRKTTKKFNATIQQLTLDIFDHALEHGDYTAFNRLYDAMSDGTRREGWMVYVVDHSSLNFDKDKSTFKLPKKSALRVDYDAMNKITWHAYTTEAVKIVDLDKMLVDMEVKAMRRYEKAMENGDEIVGNVESFLQRVEVQKQLATLN
tara:strand:+ start:1173 stop:1652 length:480 start_codon:yes stop_codon:yes gene_type:complete